MRVFFAHWLLKIRNNNHILNCEHLKNLPSEAKQPKQPDKNKIWFQRMESIF